MTTPVAETKPQLSFATLYILSLIIDWEAGWPLGTTAHGALSGAGDDC